MHWIHIIGICTIYATRALPHSQCRSMVRRLLESHPGPFELLQTRQWRVFYCGAEGHCLSLGLALPLARRLTLGRMAAPDFRGACRFAATLARFLSEPLTSAPFITATVVGALADCTALARLGERILAFAAIAALLGRPGPKLVAAA